MMAAAGAALSATRAVVAVVVAGVVAATAVTGAAAAAVVSSEKGMAEVDWLLPMEDSWHNHTCCHHATTNIAIAILTMQPMMQL